MSRECIEHSYFEELAAGVYEQRARAPALRARVVRRRALRSGTEFGLKQKGRSHNHHSYGEAHASSSAAKRPAHSPFATTGIRSLWVLESDAAACQRELMRTNIREQNARQSLARAHEQRSTRGLRNVTCVPTC